MSPRGRRGSRWLRDTVEWSSKSIGWINKFDELYLLQIQILKLVDEYIPLHVTVCGDSLVWVFLPFYPSILIGHLKCSENIIMCFMKYCETSSQWQLRIASSPGGVPQREDI